MPNPPKVHDMPPVEASHSTFLNTKFFGSLDGLRCISIAAVVFFHAGATPWRGGVGAEGVTLFFAISGFLITTLLLRERDRHGQISIGAFYMRRFLRIMPLFYATLLVYIVVVAVAEKDPTAKHEFFAHLPAFATYTSNWFVDLKATRVIFYFVWSLATEEQFYLVWPLVFRFLPLRVATVVLVGTLAATELLRRNISGPVQDQQLVVRIALSVAPALCCGVLIAIVLHHRRSFALLAPLVARRWSFVLWVGVLALILGTGGDPLLAAVSVAMLVASVVTPTDHLGASLLRFGPIANIGRVSYGIYLFHMLAINAVRRGLSAVNVRESPWLVGCLGLLASWGAANVSFRYFESWFLARGRTHRRT